MPEESIQAYIKQQKEQIYLQIINMLLNCSDEQKFETLQQNINLIDEGFIEFTQAYNQKLENDGDHQSAAYLFNFVKELVNADLIQTMKQVTGEFDKQENSKSNCLRNIAQNLTQYLENSQPSQAHLNFLLEILRTINNGGGREQVYPLLPLFCHFPKIKL